MLPWDGSTLGDITPNVTTYTHIGRILRIELDNGEAAYIHKFKTTVPLVADELKAYFGLTKVGRHRATLQGKPILMNRCLDTEGPLVAGMAINLLDVQRIHIFRWLCGFASRDKAICIRHQNDEANIPMSYIESTITYDETKAIGSRLTKATLKRWFDRNAVTANTTVTTILEGMCPSHNYMEIRMALTDLVDRVDVGMRWWVLNIVQRIGTRLSFIEALETPLADGTPQPIPQN